jgi:hypothetical protein
LTKGDLGGFKNLPGERIYGKRYSFLGQGIGFWELPKFFRYRMPHNPPASLRKWGGATREREILGGAQDGEMAFVSP